MPHRSPLQNRAKDAQRKVTPPGPSYMSSDQIASYLKDLRTNRPARPGGSRPFPTKAGAESTPNSHEDLPPRATSAMSTYSHSRLPSTTPAPEVERPRATSALSNHRPVSSRGSFSSSVGRPLVQEPRAVPVRKNVSPTRVYSRIPSVSPNTTYRENDQRRIEKEEARSLRDALQGADLQDEVRIHEDAQDEATQLVWMHQNPGIPYKNPYAPYRNPDMNQPRPDFRRSDSQETSHSFRNSWRDSHRLSLRNHSTSGIETEADPTGLHDDLPAHKRNGLPRKNLRVNFALPQEGGSGHQASDSYGLGLVGVSNDSSKGIFRNPNDQIYEEPAGLQRTHEDDRSRFSKSDSSALRSKPRNAIPQGSRPLPSRLSSIPFVDKLARFELHKHPPTQSRKPEYRTNEPPPQPTNGDKPDDNPHVPTKDGFEIRSDDIRAATSKKRSDRSTRLPMPTAVSDRAGRPIVSFDRSWKPTEVQSPTKRETGQDEIPDIHVSNPVPAAPAIEVSEAPSVPVINLPDDKPPKISEMEQSSQTSKKHAKSPSKGSRRSSSSFKRFMPSSQDRWLSTYSRAGVPTAKCEACSLPIAGKIVTAAGTRFHPECFTCNHCQTPLECVAFYQEPDAKRNERLAEAAAEDEEAYALRFYCHLDFHELFSPRCKSCKTPIEGEVVVACGAEWHVGHFFCAQCGDPFTADTPFVEKDGYAWCLQCHSRRTAPTCSGCKKPVLDDLVITAVGGKWHDQCFVCHECGDGFGAEGRYFVREGEPKRTAKGRIIGGPVQLAVCERCEGIRLKSSPRT